MAFAISEIDLQKILRSNMGDEGAKALVNFVDSKVENGFEHKKDVLATKQDLAQLEVKLTRDIANLRAELRVEIAESKVELLKWMLFIFMIVQTAAIVGLVKLLH